MHLIVRLVTLHPRAQATFWQSHARVDRLTAVECKEEAALRARHDDLEAQAVLAEDGDLLEVGDERLAGARW